MRTTYLTSDVFSNRQPFNIIIGMVNMFIFYSYAKNFNNKWYSYAHLIIQSLSVYLYKFYTPNSFLFLQLFLLSNLIVHHILQNRLN